MQTVNSEIDPGGEQRNTRPLYWSLRMILAISSGPKGQFLRIEFCQFELSCFAVEDSRR